MNFNETLNEINNFTELSQVSQIFDFMLDYEQIYIESRINTGYKHQRHSNFTDDEIIQLADTLDKKTDELLRK